MNTFHSFSSPIVDLPVVHLSFWAVSYSLGSAWAQGKGLAWGPEVEWNNVQTDRRQFHFW